MKNVINNEAKLKIVELLNPILADEFVFYTKVRNYHWNVTGTNFFGLHATFEKIYDELADDIDDIAERIRALDSKTPGTLKEFLKLTSITEEAGIYPHQLEMVQNIVNDFETISNEINSAAHKIQNEFNDEVTAGFLYGLIERYQKTLWMLKSSLEKN